MTLEIISINPRPRRCTRNDESWKKPLLLFNDNGDNHMIHATSSYVHLSLTCAIILRPRSTPAVLEGDMVKMKMNMWKNIGSVQFYAKLIL